MRPARARVGQFPAKVISYLRPSAGTAQLEVQFNSGNKIISDFNLPKKKMSSSLSPSPSPRDKKFMDMKNDTSCVFARNDAEQNQLNVKEMNPLTPDACFQARRSQASRFKTAPQVQSLERPKPRISQNKTFCPPSRLLSRRPARFISRICSS